MIFYSDTQSRRGLYKTSNKIVDELYKSNKITEKTLDSNELNKLITVVNIGLISIDDFLAIYRKDFVKPKLL